MKEEQKNTIQPLCVMPNGIGVGTVAKDMIVINFVKSSDSEGNPTEFLSSFVFSLSQAEDFSKQIQKVIQSVKSSK